MNERNIDSFAAKLSDPSLGKFDFRSIAVVEMNAPCLLIRC